MTNEPISISSAKDLEKISVDFIEDSHGDSKLLSVDHHDYLMKRLGTLHLDPLPSCDPLDPLNWTDREKISKLF